MGEDQGTAGTPVTEANDSTEAKDPEQIREEIEDTRRELGDTVEALAAKADVKAGCATRSSRPRSRRRRRRTVSAGKARGASPETASPRAHPRRLRRPSRIRSRSPRSALSLGLRAGARLTKR